ncbi:MAG: hypothetical protein HY074_08340 [Deltaproteobacteria bacterium]|nr:hypothetical protein [Deltaproteobacteria bacterium]
MNQRASSQPKSQKPNDLSAVRALLTGLALAIFWLVLGTGEARAGKYDNYFLDADQTLDQELLEDGRLDITVAFGFQQEEPSDSLIPGVKQVVKAVDSFSLDRPAIARNVGDLDRALMAKDPNFRKTISHGETVYETTVLRGGRVVPVRVNVLYPTDRKSVDLLKSKFLAALKTSDVIIYNGHSRAGDGFPDFDRPAFGHGKVFSEDTFGGHWSGTEKHPFNRFKKQVLAVVSCESDKYYHTMLRNSFDEKDPANLALILTKAPGYNEDLAPTSAALIGGLMAGNQPDAILDSMEQSAKNYYGGDFDPSMPTLFSEDGFIKRWTSAPGWRLPPVAADVRDVKVVPSVPTAASRSVASVPDAIPAR